MLSATAKFYITGKDDQRHVKVHRVTVDWTENGANWNNVAANMDTTVLASIPSQSNDPVWVNINLTALVQNWIDSTLPNYGVILVATSGGVESKYTSTEWSSTNERPWLEVVTISGVIPTQAAITATATMANGVTRTLSRSAVSLYQQPPYQLVLQPGVVAGADSQIFASAPTNNYASDPTMQVSPLSSSSARP